MPVASKGTVMPTVTNGICRDWTSVASVPCETKVV